MLRKYGVPQEATATQIRWQDNRPWTRTVVHKAGVEHDFPAKHIDVLEQVVPYKVPLNFLEVLATFNGSVVANRTRGELTAHCDREETNILALNLAHDIIRGQKTVAQAREAMAAGVREIVAGRVPDDARELRLGPPQGDLQRPRHGDRCAGARTGKRRQPGGRALRHRPAADAAGPLHPSKPVRSPAASPP